MVRRFEGPQSPQPVPFEERVREALRREAETVEPAADGLGAIRARTSDSARGRARTRWFAGGAAVLATAAAVAAIAVAGGTDLGLGGGAGRDEVAPAGPTAATRTVRLFYLDKTPERRGEPGSVTVDDPGLYAETHRVPAEGGEVETAVRALVATSPADPDYANPWQGISVRSVTANASRAVVRVNALPAAGTSEEAALQALAHTVQTATGTRKIIAVTVEADGEDPREVSAAAPVGTYANIWVTAPEQGASVASPVRFAGWAATFEGNVAYEIRRGGRVFARGATTTTGGMGVWSGWSFTQRLQAGRYTLTAFDQDPALGGRRDVETKTFTVR